MKSGEVISGGGGESSADWSVLEKLKGKMGHDIVVEDDLENSGAVIKANKKLTGRQIGSAVLTSFDGKEAELNAVNVARSQRGKGIGSEMVRSAVDFAKDKGIERISLNSTDEAVEFYERLGFKKGEDSDKNYMFMDLNEK